MRSAVRIAAAVVLLTTAAGAQGSNAVVPTHIGHGALFHPGPRGPVLGAGRVIAGRSCSRYERRVGAHLELFARGLVVLVPAGIGIAPPLRVDGLKASGGCSYPVRTREPTGVIEARSRAFRRHSGSSSRSGGSRSAGVGWSVSAPSASSASVPGWTGTSGAAIRVRSRCCGTRRSCSSSGASFDLMRVTSSRKDSDVRGLPSASRLLALLTVCAAAISLTACGLLVGPFDDDGGRGQDVPARRLPAGRRSPGRAGPTTLSFKIMQPSAKPLTAFRMGAGPHVGVHVIVVRDDLSSLIHRHPPFPPTARSTKVMFPSAGATGSWPTPIRRQGGSRTSSSSAGSPSEVSRSRPRRSDRRARSSSTAIASRSGRAEPEGDHAGISHGHGDLRRMARRRSSPLVRRIGARDLLPRRLARLLPHPRLQSRCRRMHERVVAAKVTGTSTTPGKLTVGVLVPVAARGGCSCRRRSTDTCSLPPSR